MVLMIGLFGAGLAAGHATPPADRLAVLQRGINLTNWFRYPARADDAALRDYLTDTAMETLRRAGFTFVRLAVQPELLEAAPHRLSLLVEAIGRLERRGLAVVVVPHPASWHLETSEADRARLLAFWRAAAPVLHTLDARLTFPEFLNEPVFASSPGAWEALQRAGLTVIRAALPDATVVLTGANWGGVDGLAALTPVSDPNVIYSVHFYEPAELTALAAYRPGLDRAALARLPFPMDPTACAPAVRASADDATRDLITFTCGLRWNADSITARIARAANWATIHRASVLLGEFGASHQLNAPARLAWLSAVRQACERAGIGWALWGYDDQMGFGIDPRATAVPVLDRATRAALGLDIGP
jgi:hypothetical protein